ncbi:hypothetical protein DFQ29_005854 [Apophysomyces sp. BC1021]|nr:hypothetical protein DFQ29_005854 [Apophysomyces sp. BC1021]
MTKASTNANTSMSAIDEQQQSKTIKEVLADFSLLSYQTDRLPSFLNDYDSVMQNIRQAVTYCIDAAVDLEEIKDHDKAITFLIYTRLCCLHGDPVGHYNDRWEREMADYQTLQPKKKYYTHENYLKFKQEIWDVHHPEAEMPALGDDEEDDDGDIIVGQTKVSLKCPLTTEWFKDPVSSLFDDTIMARRVERTQALAANASQTGKFYDVE